MGRKIEMKKIMDVKKCQITFSKRRSSLMKKIQETAMLYNVNVAFVAFSPAGRVHTFCSGARMEDAIQFYITLQTHQSLIQKRNLQEKLERLSEGNRIMGDNKLDYLEKQVDSLEDQIRKSNEILEFLETNLRDFEPSPEVEPSLEHYSRCERNLMNSLKSVMTRNRQAKFVESSSSSLSLPNFQTRGMPATFMFNDMEMDMLNQGQGINPPSFPSQLVTELDPWISPYSAKVCGRISQGLLDEANERVLSNNDPFNLSKTRGMPATFKFNDMEMDMLNQGQGNNPHFPSQLVTEVDPWISPYSAKVRGRISQGLLDEANEKVISNNDPFSLIKAQIQKNVPFGLQQHQSHSFGQHAETQNMQDGTLPLNQFNTNHKMQHPLPIHDSGSSSFQDSVFGSNGFELYKLPFDWEIPDTNQQHQVGGLNVDFSGPQSIPPHMDNNSLSTWNDGQSYEFKGSSHALDQPNLGPAVHGDLGGINQWTTGTQTEEEVDRILNELAKELVSDSQIVRDD